MFTNFRFPPKNSYSIRGAHLVKKRYVCPSERTFDSEVIVFVPTPTISFKWNQPRLIVQHLLRFWNADPKLQKLKWLITHPRDTRIRKQCRRNILELIGCSTLMYWPKSRAIVKMKQVRRARLLWYAVNGSLGSNPSGLSLDLTCGLLRVPNERQGVPACHERTTLLKAKLRALARHCDQKDRWCECRPH